MLVPRSQHKIQNRKFKKQTAFIFWYNYLKKKAVFFKVLFGFVLWNEKSANMCQWRYAYRLSELCLHPDADNWPPNPHRQSKPCRDLRRRATNYILLRQTGQSVKLTTYRLLDAVNEGNLFIVPHPTKRRDGMTRYTFTPIINCIWYN